MTQRCCPLCGADDPRSLMEPTAAEIARDNWTYAPETASILEIEPAMRFPIVRCARCGFVYARLRPPDEFLVTLYERVIRHESSIEASENAAGYARRCRHVADLLELAPAAKNALDFGAGLGVTVRILRACGIDAIGFDPSPARQEYSGGAADRDALARSAPFAMLILDNVLEHVPDPLETLALLKTLCAPGAVAYVSVPPYEDSFVEGQIVEHRAGRPLDMTLNPWEHLNYFSRAALDRLMAAGGFAPVAPPAPPDIGLRRETARAPRIKNAAASAVRLLRWAGRGEALGSAQHRFYRQSN